MKPACLTHVLVTLGETVSVSALLWLLMLSPAIKLASVYNGEPPRSVVSNENKTYCGVILTDGPLLSHWSCSQGFNIHIQAPIHCLFFKCKQVFFQQKSGFGQRFYQKYNTISICSHCWRYFIINFIISLKFYNYYLAVVH